MVDLVTSLSTLSRRKLLSLAAGGFAIAAQPAFAQSAPWDRLAPARKLLGESEPLTKGLAIELPLLSEDGSSVPMTVSAESPMTADDYIEWIALFAARNPNPEIAVLRFSPRSAPAHVQTRVRLNESQSVIAIARSSKGATYAASRDIRITTSGCLARAGDSDGSQEMQPRVRAPAKVRRGEPAEILTLISHPMETGLRELPGGGVAPQRIIRTFEAKIGGEPVFTAELHRSLAANPYLRFFVQPRQSGSLVMTWTEDSGRTAEARASLDVV
jgi:sulfur-oxidizing protein SoxY